MEAHNIIKNSLKSFDFFYFNIVTIYKIDYGFLFVK